MNLSFLLYLLALVLLFVSIFPVPSRFNLMAAGLFSALLAFLLTSGALHH